MVVPHVFLLKTHGKQSSSLCTYCQPDVKFFRAFSLLFLSLARSLAGPDRLRQVPEAHGQVQRHRAPHPSPLQGGQGVAADRGRYARGAAHAAAPVFPGRSGGGERGGSLYTGRGRLCPPDAPAAGCLRPPPARCVRSSSAGMKGKVGYGCVSVLLFFEVVCWMQCWFRRRRPCFWATHVSCLLVVIVR